jgi:CRISPR system Cascade subunit CasA
MTQVVGASEPPRYNLLEEPWVPCLDRSGTLVVLGLLDCLSRAHELREVRDESPLVTFGLDRLLLAMVQEQVAPRDKAAWVDHFCKGRFDPALIERIRVKDNDRFDLFHPTHPFYQSGDVLLEPELGSKSPGTTTVGRLRAEVPSDTNVNHFHHAYDDEQAYCPACTARGLVTLAPFAPSSGQPYTPSINGDPPIYVWLGAANLFETLSWNLILGGNRPKAAAAADRTAWRGDGVVPARHVKPEVGFLESLTWQPRRVRLLPDGAGCCTLCGRHSPVLVRQMFWTQGCSRPKDATWWQDPFVAYVGGGDDRPRPVRAQEDRPLWRDYAVLFLPALESSARHPARIIEQALRLGEALEDAGLSVPPPILQCYAVRSDLAKVFEWRSEAFPFTTRLADNPGRAAVVERALEKAEDVAGILKRGLKQLYPRAGKGNRKAFDGLIQQAQDAYWPRLAEPFRRLAISLDNPELDSEPLEDSWRAKVRGAATAAFQLVADTFDTNADALRRVAAARRLFYGTLRKKLP